MSANWDSLHKSFRWRISQTIRFRKYGMCCCRDTEIPLIFLLLLSRPNTPFLLRVSIKVASVAFLVFQIAQFLITCNFFPLFSIAISTAIFSYCGLTNFIGHHQESPGYTQMSPRILRMVSIKSYMLNFSDDRRSKAWKSKTYFLGEELWNCKRQFHTRAMVEKSGKPINLKWRTQTIISSFNPLWSLKDNMDRNKQSRTKRRLISCIKWGAGEEAAGQIVLGVHKVWPVPEPDCQPDEEKMKKTCSGPSSLFLTGFEVGEGKGQRRRLC